MNAVNSFRARLLIVAAIMLTGFSILVFKLWYEQIHFGERYRQSITRQSVRRVRLPGMRGKIFTSDYLLLADNEPGHNLVFYLQEMRLNSRKRTIENIRSIAEKMAHELNRPDTLDEKAIRKHIITSPGLPLVIYKNLSAIELARAYQLMPQMPGVGIEVEPLRSYPQNDMASLTLGFARPEDAHDAPDRKKFTYYQAGFEGRSGVERAFDQMVGNLYIPGLRSQPGYELMQVDHLGYVNARRLEYLAPTAGNNIVLTLDGRAQKLAEKVMRNQRGALVLLNADTGEVLAIVSTPRMDISRTTPSLKQDYYNKLLSDPGLPMFDRATQGSYMPGSIVKPLVALAALKAGISAEHSIECDGRSIINGARISCANRYGHGKLDMLTAIERSCNDYFIETGLELGAEKLSEMYSDAGVGESTGLETGGIRGLNPAGRIRSANGKWRDYDTANISIGQGMILVSPLQAARFTAAIANGGKLMKLTLLKEVYSDNGRLLFRNQPQVDKEWQLPENAFDLVRKGMYQVVNSNQGSGKSAKSNELTIYGKTGTAEVDTRNGRVNNTWFSCFTEKNNVRYALTILVEEGRSGGRDCAPLAKKFLEDYLREQR